MNFFRTHLLRFLLPLALAALGAGACALLVPAEIESVRQQLIGFPDSDIPAHQARPWVLGGLCFLPALAGFVYCLGGTLDRYLARQFFGIFSICLASLLTIWFLMDLGDKIGDFRKSSQVFQTILVFYGTRSPAVLLLLLPYSLLLALLYSLGKLSGTREVIAMIQAGRSIIRLALPLFIAGLFFSLFSLGLNYHWAPNAEGQMDAILDAANDRLPVKSGNKDRPAQAPATDKAPAAGEKSVNFKAPATATTPQAAPEKQAVKARQVLYQNPSQHRLWEIGIFPQNYHKGEPLREVEITTTRPDKTLESRITAKSASWDKTTHAWTFEDAVIARYKPDMPPIFETLEGPLVIGNWTETPWQLVKPGLSAAYLGIPDLGSWLKENARIGQFAEPAPYLTQWHYRWALPFACMVTVLLATPLAIHFSRRGPGGGIFLAVVLSALMLLCSNISLAVGEAGTLRPGVAAWLPNAAFTLLGLYLFRRRVTGKPIYLILRRLFPGND